MEKLVLSSIPPNLGTERKKAIGEVYELLKPPLRYGYSEGIDLEELAEEIVEATWKAFNK